MFFQLKYMFIIFVLLQHDQMVVYGIGKQYTGCFVDHAGRVMPYKRLDGSGSMTNDICVSHCCLSLVNATYIGTEASYVCFCSNVTNTNNFVIRDPSSGKDCDMTCDGNQNEMCGGSWSLSVYRIECSSETTVTTITPTTSDVSTLTSTVTAESNEEDDSLSTDTQLTTNTPTTSDISTSTKELTTESTVAADSLSTYKTMTTNYTPTTNDISTLTSKVSTESTETGKSLSTETTTNTPTTIEISTLTPELTTEATTAGNSPSTDRTLTTDTPTTNDISTSSFKPTSVSTVGAFSTLSEITTTNKETITSKINTITSDVTTKLTTSSLIQTTNKATTSDISTSSTNETNEASMETNSPSATYIQEFTVDATVGSNNCMCPCANYLPFNISLWTEKELVKRLTLLKSIISVNKKETNMYKGNKKSAYDPRKFSRNIGLFGVIILVFPVIFVVVIDIQQIFK